MLAKRGIHGDLKYYEENHYENAEDKSKAQTSPGAFSFELGY